MATSTQFSKQFVFLEYLSLVVRVHLLHASKFSSVSPFKPVLSFKIHIYKKESFSFEKWLQESSEPFWMREILCINLDLLLWIFPQTKERKKLYFEEGNDFNFSIPKTGFIFLSFTPLNGVQKVKYFEVTYLSTVHQKLVDMGTELYWRVEVNPIEDTALTLSI